MTAGARRERAAVLVLWGLAAAACVLGVLAKPPTVMPGGLRAQVLDLLRVLCTTALVLVVVLGPGVVLRSLLGRREVGLGFLPLPGIVLLICVGGLAWVLAKPVGAHVVSFAVLTPVLAGLLYGALRAGPEGMLEPGERRALLTVGCLLGLAIARALWSLGPEGELFAGGISRTLEVGSRPDSRIPFHVVQLVANGTAPYSELGSSYFSPYNFSSRGPLAGIASAPLVLMAGGTPPTGLPDGISWTPFDPQGFMAFRLAMMTLSSTALLSLWTLTRRLAGARAAQFAVLLAATTPFLLHETWFTWPKMLAASMALLTAVLLIERRPLSAGLVLGFGYLMHPVALLSLPALLLLALWPLAGAQLKRPQVKQALWLLFGVGVFVLLWRLVNGSNFRQDDFLIYLTEAGPGIQASPWADPATWGADRLESIGNTLVPMLLALAHGDNPSINFFGGTSPPIIHIFFQYWNTLPFGVGIVFFPLLLLSLWRAFVRWKWAVFVAVVVPFVTFAVYWGSYTTGMLPEGLQTWVITLFAVVAVQQRQAAFAWLRSTPIRVVLTLRVVEMLAVVLVPTLATRSELVSAQYNLVDTAALLGVAGFCACLGALVWRSDPSRTAKVPSSQRADR